MLDVVVRDVASFRIDPADLKLPGRSLAMLASPDAAAHLTHGQRAAFDSVIVLDAVTCSSIVDGVLRLTATYGEDDVRLLCHDEYSLLAVAQARQALGLEGATPGQIVGFTDKLAMKQIVAEAGVRVPKHQPFDAAAWEQDPDAVLDGIEATLGFPVFVKPLSESGTVGGEKLPDAAAFADWAARRDRAKTFEVDEFVTGTLHHVDTVSYEGRGVFVGVNTYAHPCYDYLDGAICSSRTVDPDEASWGPLREFSAAVLDAFEGQRPDDSAFHLEIFETPAGELVFLEIAARAPAALVPAAYEKRWGFNVELAHFRVQQGVKPERLDGAPLDDRVDGPAAAWAYWPRSAGTVTGIRPPQLAADHRFTWGVREGQVLADPNDIREYAGTVLFWSPDRAALAQDLQRCDSAVVLALD